MTPQFTTYTPLEYIKIDVATNFGDGLVKGSVVDLDKENFEERIAWFDRNEASLASLVDLADKPALFFAGLQAYDAALRGVPSGYPVSLDACSSGLQILAVTVNCHKSASMCGIINTGKREDAYTGVFTAMKRDADGIHLEASRKDLKQALMTSLYGSKAQPKKLFGEATPALQLYYATVEKEIPGAWELNLDLKSLWQSYEDSHSWTLPDNFQVCKDVEALETNEVAFLGETVEVYTKQVKGTPKGLSLSPDIVHSIDGFIVREITRRCNYDQAHIAKVRNLAKNALKGNQTSKRKSILGRGRKKDKQLKALWLRYMASGYFSLRMLDLIDQANIGIVSASSVMAAIKSLPDNSFRVMAIHDCFRVLPAYANDLRYQYNIIMSQLAASEILSDIASQITGEKLVLKKKGDISADILNANYALS